MTGPVTGSVTGGVTGRMARDCDGDCAVATSFARIAALSPPVVPPALAERIIRDVPHLAQLPAPFAPLRAPLRARALRLVITPPVQRATAGRRPVAGWAALAAGLAAVALMLPAAFPARQSAQAAAASPPRRIARVQPAPVRVPAVPARAVTMAINHPAPMPEAPGASSLPVPQAPLPLSPGPALSPVPEAAVEVAATQPVVVQVADVGPIAPPRPVYGPPDTEAQSLPGLSSRGGGPGAAPGFAFTGHGPAH